MTNKSNIYLVGFMGTGKSTVGKLLAKRLNKKFIDVDHLITEREQMTIYDIFHYNGEAYFRNLEQEFLEHLYLNQTDSVISCGGGSIFHASVFDLITKTSQVILLKASVSVIYSRIIKEYHTRPLLEQPTLSDIEKLVSKYAAQYPRAAKVINTDNLSPDEVTDQIISIL